MTTDTLLSPTEEATMLLNLYTLLTDAIEASEILADCKGVDMDYTPYTFALTNIYSNLMVLSAMHISIRKDPDVVEAIEELKHDLDNGSHPRD